MSDKSQLGGVVLYKLWRWRYYSASSGVSPVAEPCGEIRMHMLEQMQTPDSTEAYRQVRWKKACLAASDDEDLVRRPGFLEGISHPMLVYISAYIGSVTTLGQKPILSPA